MPKADVLKKIIEKIENTRIEFCLLTLFSLITLRWAIECIIGIHKEISDIKFYISQIAWFFSLFFSYVLITQPLTGEKLEKIIKSFSVGFIVIILAPIINYVNTAGQGDKIEYVYGNLNKLIGNFIFFYSGEPAVSVGMKIGIILGFVLIANYIKLKTKKWNVAILSILCLYYPIGFIYGSLPEIAKLSYNLVGNLLNISTIGIANISVILGLIIFVQLIIFAQKLNYLKYLRVFGSLHYIIMAIAGFLVYTNFTIPSVTTLFKLILLFTIFFVAFNLASFVNDIFDYKIDLITNKKRLLTEKIASKMDLINFIIFCFVYVSLFSYIIGEKTFLMFLTLLSISLIYSCPPLRLRNYIFSNVIVGLCSLISFIIGYEFIAKKIIGMPALYLWLILVCISLGSTIKDIKDEKGDKKNNVSNILIKFGKNGKLIISFCVGAAFSISAVFMKLGWFMSLLVGIIPIITILISKKNIQEKVYLMYIIYFAFLLFTQIN